MLIDILLSCLTWAIYSLSCWGLGARILRVYYPQFHQDSLLNPGLGLALGLGIFGSLWSVAALFQGGLQPLIIASVLTIGIIAGWRDIASYISSGTLKAILPKDRRLLLIALPVLAFLVCVPVMTWYQMGTDAQAFYFAQAKLAAYRQTYIPLPGYESFSQIALPAEFTYAALINIGPELGARMITATQVMIGVLLLAAIVRDCGSGLAGRWLGVIAFITSSSVTLLISDGKTDLYGGALSLAALYLFLFTPDLSRRHLVLMGMVAGFAVLAKLTFLPVFVPMLGLLLFWRFWQRDASLKAAANTVTGGFIISGMVLFNLLPLIAKNYLFFAEPFAPFYFIDATKDAGLQNQVWYSPENTAWILKTYPFVWTFGQYPMQHGVLSPILWAGLPALMYISWKKIEWLHDPAIALAFAGLVGMLFWAVFFPATVAPRYIFPALFAFIPLGVKGLEILWHEFESDRLRNLAFTAIIFVFAAFPVYNNFSEVKNGIRMAIGSPTKSEIKYVAQGLQAAEAMIGENDRILLFGWQKAILSGKSLSCLGSYMDADMRAVSASPKNGLKYWPDLREKGFKAIVINLSEPGMRDFSQKLAESRKPAWLKIKTHSINGYYTIHEMIVNEAKAPPLKKICAPDERGIWKITDVQSKEQK